MLKKDPSCDFGGLVKGTKGYLKAQFVFSKEWDNCIKVAGFFSSTEEYEPQKLDERGFCNIPDEALKKQSFNIRVYGKRDGFYIQTNRLNIVQDGGI